MSDFTDAVKAHIRVTSQFREQRGKARAKLAAAEARAEKAEGERDALREEIKRLQSVVVLCPECVAAEARVEKAEGEARIANENVRLRETSQIPMIPLGAQRRLEALEAERDAALAHVEALKVEGEGLVRWVEYELSVCEADPDEGASLVAAWRKTVDGTEAE